MSAPPTWEIRLMVTCTEEECEDLMVEVLELADGRGYGAVVGCSAAPPDEDDVA